MNRRPVFFLGLAALFLACGSQSTSSSRVVGAPVVEYTGCWAVYLPGPVCSLRTDRKLSLWVKNDSDLTMEIRVGDRIVKASGQPIADGRRFRLKQLPRKGSPLTVRLCRADGTCGSPWSLILAPPEEPEWFDRINKLQSRGKRQEARQQLEELRKTAPAKEQGLVLRSLANLAHKDGDLEKEATYLEQGIAADRAVRNLKGEADRVTELARLYIDQDRFSKARQLLDALPPSPELPAGSKYLVAFFRGRLAARVADYRSALEQLRQAADLARRVDLIRPRWQAEQVLAGVLQDLGRSQEASDMFERLRAEVGADLGKDTHLESPCDLGSLLTNWAWSRLLAREGEGATSDPTQILREAQTIFDGNQCARPEQRLNARLNLALAHQQMGRWSEADRALEEARAFVSNANPHYRLWWLDLEARAAMERQPARALQLYDELAGEAETALSLEGHFRASVGRAHAHLALNQRAAALADFAEANRLIDEESSHVPVHEGRDTLVGQRENATRQYLELLLAEGHRQRAFDLVRRDRSRLLRQLAIRDRLTQLNPEEQQKWDQALTRYQELRASINQEAARQWQLPLDQVERSKEKHASQLTQAQQDLDRAVEGLGDSLDRGESSLSPPGQGELILAYHPLSKGWVGFAAHKGDVEVSKFELFVDPPADPQAQARLLLAPFRKAIEHAVRIRVLPYGVLRSIDFHALPFGGEPLLAHHLVVYSLDLPVHSGRPSPAPSGRSVALLVSNPQSDQGYLPAAQQEAKTVAEAIGNWGHGWTLKRLDGKEANSSAVSTALLDADLFHFAGHGSFAGFAGWDSALPLADRSRLTLGDVLMLHPVPRWVVLSACDAGRSSEQAPGEGIGLANAFLLAGAQAVIAATRPVVDDDARDLLSELYRGWQPGTDLAGQLQRAQLACHRQHPKADCTSFRLLEP
jgi:tetratricopeptide (TPR) repeat protein